MALTAEGRILVTGGLDGKVETRNLDAEAAILRDRSWTVPANRGKVVQIDGNRASQRLLVLTDDSQGPALGPQESHLPPAPGLLVFRRLPGRRQSRPHRERRRPARAGKVVRVRHDRDPGPVRARARLLQRTSGSFKVPEHLAFEGLTRSPDGTRVAATAAVAAAPRLRLGHEDRRDDPLVEPPGRPGPQPELLHRRPPPGDRRRFPRGPALGPGGRPGELKTPEVMFQDPAIATERHLRGDPARPEQVVTGHSDGKVNLLDPEAREGPSDGLAPGPGRLRRRGQRRSPSPTAAGTWRRPARARASGSARSRSEPARRGSRRAPASPLRADQRLLSWDDPNLLISGSDDTTVRFWDLKRHALWGTFSAAGHGARREREPAGPGPGLGLLHSRRVLRCLRLRRGPRPVPPP